MNCFVATKEVKKILDSEDNIIEQKKNLRKYRYRKGGKNYIDKLICANQSLDNDESKYILYCIIKYYYEIDIVKEMKPMKIRLYSYLKSEKGD